MLQDVGILLLWFTSSLWAIVFRLILESCCVMLMVWDGFVASLKGCYWSKFGLKVEFTGVAKMLLQPSGMLLRGLAQ